MHPRPTNRQQAVLITGAAGGIGSALCREFKASGWFVLATDLAAVNHGDNSPAWDHFLPLDLGVFARNAGVRKDFAGQVQACLAVADGPPKTLACLINNAAVQRLSPTDAVTEADWNLSLDVNLSAPFWLTQTLLPELERAVGSVVNIASIHAQLTKPGFVTYATTKAALAGLTRALAVDLGSRVRVNAICPAAISTPMLEAGFAGRPEARHQLDEFHPAGRIGQPEEVAQLALQLAGSGPAFLTGACFTLDGGISGRLHDPA